MRSLSRARALSQAWDRDVQRAGAPTLVAADAPAGLVICPSQVKGALLAQPDPHPEPGRIVALEEAGRAVAHRAGLAAGIAAQAAVELLQPVGQALLRPQAREPVERILLQGSRRRREGLSDQSVTDERSAFCAAEAARLQRPRARDCLVRDRSLPRALEDPGADDADDMYLLAGELVFGQEHVDRPAIASLHNNPNRPGRLALLPWPQTGGQIGCRVVRGGGVPNQAARLLRSLDENGPRPAAGAGLLA